MKSKLRNKTLLIVVFSTIFILFGAKGIMHLRMSNNTIKEEVVCAKVDNYDNIEELKEDADIIITGTKINEEPSQVFYAENGCINLGYTLSDIRIDSINTTTPNSALSVGDTIKILENEFFDEKSNTNYHIDGYCKMKNNESYMLFLRYSEDNAWYIPLGVVFGKVPIDENEDNLLTDDLELKNKVDTLSNEIYEEYDLSSFE